MQWQHSGQLLKQVANCGNFDVEFWLTVYELSDPGSGIRKLSKADPCNSGAGSTRLQGFFIGAFIMKDMNVARDHRGHFIKRAIPAAVRRQIATRYGCKPGSEVVAPCAYCSAFGGIHWRVQPSDRGEGWVCFSNLEIDHKVPEYLGGKNDLDNLTLACRRCNRSKSYKDESDWAGRCSMNKPREST